ncbi:MAG: class I SAM-dependent methyltransferase [Pseudanabaena sp. ELA607]
MTTTPTKAKPAPNIATQLVNTLLNIKPLFGLAKTQARNMMIKRAGILGIDWLSTAAALRNQNLEAHLQAVENKQLQYPDYYLRPFHAYEDGNMGWLPATEVEVAAYAVHSRVWGKEAAKDGDARLRQSYHDILKAYLAENYLDQNAATSPQTILDAGCSVGMSTFALQQIYPSAQITGLDLSPYFLAVASHNQKTYHPDSTVQWVHGAAESTNFADHSFDLVSIFLTFHELPADITRQVLQEARRILRPGGYFAMMDMNPFSDIYAKMPPYILTLLKSTEPYLDEYFGFDFANELVAAGFAAPFSQANSPRHRTIIAKALK